MIRRPPRSTLFPYTNALPICNALGAKRRAALPLQEWSQPVPLVIPPPQPAPPGVVPADCKRVDWVLIACCERVVPYKLHTNAIGFGCFPYPLPPHSPLHTLLHTQTLPLPKSYTVDRCRICLQPDSALQIHPLPIQAQTSGMNGTFCAANSTAFLMARGDRQQE